MRRYAIILSFYIFWKILQLATVVEGDVAGAFSASYNHTLYAFGFSALIATFVLAVPLSRIPASANLHLLLGPLLVLHFYQVLSAIWSPVVVVSLGQSIYSIYYSVIAVTMANLAIRSQENFSESLKRFLLYFTFIIVIDYVIESIYNLMSGLGPLVAIDENVIIALAIYFLFLVGGQNSRLRSFVLLAIAVGGKSFSGLASGGILVFGLLWVRKHLFKKAFIFTAALAGASILAFVILEGIATFYGKDINFFMTGSGRFMVWSALAYEIEFARMVQLIFGSGFMSERTVLVMHHLPWAVDAHNNVLQVLWGLGLIGLSLVILVWFKIDQAIRRARRFNIVPRDTAIILRSSNLALIFFGLTASTYFSRPSMSAVFMTGVLCLLGHYLGSVRAVPKSSRVQGLGTPST